MTRAYKSTTPAPEQGEPCNFKETLNQWEEHNRPERRCASSGSAKRPTSNQPTRRTLTNKNFSLESDESLNLYLKGNSFEGVTFVRTKYGETRQAVTNFEVGLNLQYQSILLGAKRPNWCAFGDAYQSKAGNFFNFDGIIYELARLAAIADFHDDLMDVVKVLPEFGYIAPSSASRNRRGFVHLEAIVKNRLTSREQMVVLLSNALGSKVHVRGADLDDDFETLRLTKSEISSLLLDLSKFYEDSGCHCNFMLAYLCGIHNIIRVCDGSLSATVPLYEDVLARVEFPRPFGNFNDVPETHTGEINHRPAVRDALRTAALVGISDPGDTTCPEWKPFVSVASTPDQHLSNISQSAASFFRLWLVNCCALFTETPQTPSDAIVANMLCALRKTRTGLSLLSTAVAPWYAIEPTHILQPHQIYATFGCEGPLAPANGIPVDAPCLTFCSGVERVNSPRQSSAFTLKMRLHNLRQNLLLWVLANDVSTSSSVSQPLRYLPGGLPTALNPNGYVNTSVQVQSTGFYGLLDEAASSQSIPHVQVVTSPLYDKPAPHTAFQIGSTTLGSSITRLFPEALRDVATPECEVSVTLGKAAESTQVPCSNNSSGTSSGTASTPVDKSNTPSNVSNIPPSTSSTPPGVSLGSSTPSTPGSSETSKKESPAGSSVPRVEFGSGSCTKECVEGYTACCARCCTGCRIHSRADSLSPILSSVSPSSEALESSEPEPVDGNGNSAPNGGAEH